MCKKMATFSIILILLFPCSSWSSTVENAEVLPRGVFSLSGTYYHHFDIHKKYDKHGNAVPLAQDFNTDLDSTVFPGLAPLDPFVGGNANIGRSSTEFTLLFDWFDFTFAYGVTDRILFGVYLPYKHSKNNVKASVDTSRANVGKNATLNTLAPLGVPGTVPLTTQDVGNLLGRGLDINGDGTIDVTGYGYKPFKTWTGSSIGDMQVLGKYQIFNGDPWRLAVSGGLRLPTGEKDDLDSLVDVPSGDGQTDVLLRAHLDFIGIKNLCINGTARYDIQLADEKTLRVPPSVHMPLTNYKEGVDRNLGDILEYEIAANYSFTTAFSGGLKYRYAYKFKDSVQGRREDSFYTSLEDETNASSHIGFVFLGFSTVQMFKEKKFPLPLGLTVEYRNRFAGRNGPTKSQYIAGALDVYF
jgi:hypothetical protein